jgi:(p)ppGpp synthase/HD superfamily hydrolase
MLTRRFDEALVYASDVHRAQRKKGTAVPYVAHLLGVASLVLEDGGDEDQSIAALLHDAVEDQGGAPRLDEIRGRFGPRVAGIVEACSDSDVIPKPPWLARKRAYIRHLRGAPDEVLRVSGADKLYNARAVLADFRVAGDAVFARFTGGKAGTLWYYGCLVNVFSARRPGPLSDELARVVEALRSLAAPGLAWPGSEEEDP